MLGSKLQVHQIADTFQGQRILMRVDFNVPVKDGVVKDSTRITATLPTIQLALEKGAKSVVLISHLGRPDGRVVPKDSLRPVAAELERLLGHSVTFLEDCVGEAVQQACADPAPGSVFLLENLRFHPEEEGTGVDEHGAKVKPSVEAVDEFRNQLTALGDIFVNDAFGTAHRAHSSMVGVKLEKRAAGLLMGKELEYFSKALETPARPLCVIMGGAKVKDKIKLIFNLLDLANDMIIGGGMAFTFLKKLHGVEIGNSLYDAEGAEIVEGIMQKAQEKGVNIHLPVDFRCGNRFEVGCDVQVTEGHVPEGWIGMDVGPKTSEIFSRVLHASNTVVWNGPAGVFENPPFAQGSTQMFQDLIEGSTRGQISIAGGGDTAAFIMTKGADSAKISHISTGGGASLELMEGRVLPGVVHLTSIA
jgi:phosphoglycerate kinase